MEFKEDHRNIFEQVEHKSNAQVDEGKRVKAHIPEEWQEGGDGFLPICHSKNAFRNFHNHL